MNRSKLFEILIFSEYSLGICGNKGQSIYANRNNDKISNKYIPDIKDSSVELKKKKLGKEYRKLIPGPVSKEMICRGDFFIEAKDFSILTKCQEVIEKEFEKSSQIHLFDVKDYYEARTIFKPSPYLNLKEYKKTLDTNLRKKIHLLPIKIKPKVIEFFNNPKDSKTLIGNVSGEEFCHFVKLIELGLAYEEKNIKAKTLISRKEKLDFIPQILLLDKFKDYKTLRIYGQKIDNLIYFFIEDGIKILYEMSQRVGSSGRSTANCAFLHKDLIKTCPTFSLDPKTTLSNYLSMYIGAIEEFRFITDQGIEPEDRREIFIDNLPILKPLISSFLGELSYILKGEPDLLFSLYQDPAIMSLFKYGELSKKSDDYGIVLEDEDYLSLINFSENPVVLNNECFGSFSELMYTQEEKNQMVMAMIDALSLPPADRAVILEKVKGSVKIRVKAKDNSIVFNPKD